MPQFDAKTTSSINYHFYQARLSYPKTFNNQILDQVLTTSRERYAEFSKVCI